MILLDFAMGILAFAVTLAAWLVLCAGGRNRARATAATMRGIEARQDAGEAELLADLMKAMDKGCLACWRAEHKPPPDSALYLMDDYKHALRQVLHRDREICELAADCGYDGADLRYDAHREAYAAGDDTAMARMLRHVAPEEA